MIRLTINVSLILLLLSVSFRPVISALDGPNLALNVTESPAFKKSNLRIRNDMASRSVRQLDQSAYAYQFSATEIGAVITRKDWMRHIPNNTKLTALSLPGTHNSMTFQSYDLELAHCQSITLKGQLQSGIRALDIRCRHINDACAIHHGQIYLDASLDDVFQTIRFFLQNHPQEAIFMRIRGDEYESFNNTRTWEETLATYKYRYQTYIWNGDIQSGAIPNMKDIRRKIVIDDTTSSSWGEYFNVQDEYKVATFWNLYDKWTNVKLQLQMSAASQKSLNRNTVFVNFLSGSSTLGLTNPWFVASGHSDSATDSDFRNTGVKSASDIWQDFPRRDCSTNSICSIFFKGINYLFYDYVKAATPVAGSKTLYLGIVYADFPGKDLIELIIQQNK